jgi:hypothetical protein
MLKSEPWFMGSGMQEAGGHSHQHCLQAGPHLVVSRSVILPGAAEQGKQCFELQGMYFYGPCTTVLFGRWFQLKLWRLMHHR